MRRATMLLLTTCLTIAGALHAQGIDPIVSRLDKAKKDSTAKLVVAYKQAISDYKKKKMDDKAKAVEEELKAFEKAMEDLAATVSPVAVQGPEVVKIATGELDPRGRPFNYQPGQGGARIAIWVDERGVWHLRVSPIRQGRIYKGKITVRGGAWVRPVASINGGQGKKADIGNFTDSSTFSFEFSTPKGGEDGMDFRITGSDALLVFEVDTKVGGLSPTAIVVGQEGKSPATIPFQLSNRFVGVVGR